MPSSTCRRSRAFPEHANPPASKRPPPVISVERLSKRFGDCLAVDELSFTVEHGETLGLLGPNGAGKTSTMRILAGLSPADAGTIQVAGLDARRQGRQIRELMGVVTQQDGLDEELSVRQNLESFGYLCGLPLAAARRRAAEVLAFFALDGRAEEEVDALSGGMKRRLAIARALMIEPRVIVLDEPTTGLDPHSRSQVWEKLAELKARGVTVLMSTHYMEEAAVLCDRIAIMDRGRILALAPPDELVRRHAGEAVTEIRLGGESAAALRAQLRESGLRWRELGALFRLLDPAPPDLAFSALPGLRIERRAANLEDVFIRLTGKELGDE